MIRGVLYAPAVLTAAGAVETVANGSVEGLASYGALGVMCVYLIWKDQDNQKQAKEREERHEETIASFTKTIDAFKEVLIDLKPKGRASGKAGEV